MMFYAQDYSSLIFDYGGKVHLMTTLFPHYESQRVKLILDWVSCAIWWPEIELHSSETTWDGRLEFLKTIQSLSRRMTAFHAFFTVRKNGFVGRAAAAAAQRKAVELTDVTLESLLYL